MARRFTGSDADAVDPGVQGPDSGKAMLAVLLVFPLIDLNASGPGQDLNSPLYAFRAS